MKIINKNKRLLIDFDGTIAQFRKGWNNGEITEPPEIDAKWALKALVDAGYEVVIFCTRLTEQNNGHDVIDQKSKIKKWLKIHGFKKGTHYHRMTNVKEAALGYIDDRGIRYENNWSSLVKLFV